MQSQEKTKTRVNWTIQRNHRTWKEKASVLACGYFSEKCIKEYQCKELIMQIN